MQEQKQRIELKVSAEEDVAPLLGDRYVVESVIGEGGMSTVYKVFEPASQKHYAAKVLKSSLLSDQTARQRFEQEARLVQGLEHENIARVLHHDVTADGTPFLIMEWIDGNTLAEHIAKNGRLSEKDAIPVFSQILEAINYAHSKDIVHRDVKPSNIMLLPDGNSWKVKVMDFGIAKILTSEQATEASLKTGTGNVLGSPAYMSPEQCMGEQVDRRSDIYSLGCVMTEALTGKNPFVASTPVGTLINHVEARPDVLLADQFEHYKVPKYLEHAILNCLAKQPDLRYQSAADAQRALYESPSVFRRAAASALDLGILGLICYFVQIMLSSTINLPIEMPLVAGLADLLRISTAAVPYAICALYVGYFAVFERLLRATPGKFLLGLRVVNANGGRPSAMGAVFRALTMCAMVVLPLSVAHSDNARLIDNAIGSHFELVFIGGGWLLAALVLYLLYSLFAIVCENGRKQWDLDRLFNRAVLSRKASRLCKVQSAPPRFTVVAYAVAAFSLLVAVGFPALEEYLSTRVWADPAVPKDHVVRAVRTIKRGETLKVSDLGFGVQLCQGHYGPDPNFSYLIYQPQSLIGRKTKKSIYEGSYIVVDDVDSLNKVEPTAETLTHIAAECEKDGNKAAALDGYLRASRVDAKCKEAWDGLARIYQEDGRGKEAAHAQEKARQADSEMQTVLAEQLNESRQFRDAISVVLGGLEEKPGNLALLKQLEIALRGLEAEHSANVIHDQISRERDRI